MTFFLFPPHKRLFGMDTQILTDERRAVEEAMEMATESGEPQTVTVDKEKFIVKDPGRVGREIEPA